MIKNKVINLNDNQIKTLNIILTSNDSRNKAKTKAKVILLKDEGKSIKEIIKATSLSKRTIISYVKDFNNPNREIGGYRFIHKNNYKKSSLNIFDENGENIILNEFKKFKGSKDVKSKSYKSFALRLKETYDISISESALRRYLNKNHLYSERSFKTTTTKNKQQ